METVRQTLESLFLYAFMLPYSLFGLPGDLNALLTWSLVLSFYFFLGWLVYKGKRRRIFWVFATLLLLVSYQAFKWRVESYQ